jgi:hypothetical protein
VKEVAESEDSVSAAQRAFYKAALPALPALLLGFLSLEGRHLVRASCPLANVYGSARVDVSQAAVLTHAAVAAR